MATKTHYTKLLRNGQITLPKALRDKLNVEMFAVTISTSNNIILTPVKPEPKKKKEKEQTPEEVRDILIESGKYTNEFIQDMYESLKESEEGKSIELKGSLMDLYNDKD